MPTMRMPWSKSGNLQLDLLDAPAVPEAAPSPQVAPDASARSASMAPTANLYEDANNPRTEIPEGELDELADYIRQHGILQPIVVHPADAVGRHQIHFGAKRWRAAQRIGLLEVPVVVRDGPTNPYAQVAENQKRHGLTPLDLAQPSSFAAASTPVTRDPIDGNDVANLFGYQLPPWRQRKHLPASIEGTHGLLNEPHARLAMPVLFAQVLRASARGRNGNVTHSLLKLGDGNLLGFGDLKKSNR